jgi:hypothetical protein
MRRIALISFCLLSACTYETVEGLKEDAGKTYALKSARPAREYADCVQKTLNSIPRGLIGAAQPATLKEKPDHHFEVSSLQFRPVGYTLIPWSGFVYMYTIDVAADGTGSTATGYVHPIYESAGEVWAAMDQCVASQ